MCFNGNAKYSPDAAGEHVGLVEPSLYVAGAREWYGQKDGWQGMVCVIESVDLLFQGLDQRARACQFATEFEARNQLCGELIVHKAGQTGVGHTGSAAGLLAPGAKFVWTTGRTVGTSRAPAS